MWSEYDLDDGKALVKLIFEDAKDDWHFHVEFGHEDMTTAGFEQAPIERIRTLMESLYGSGLDAVVIGFYIVPASDIPKRGIIQSLNGLPTAACGTPMTLTGAVMRIEGETFDEVFWYFEEENVRVALHANIVSRFTQGYLDSMASTMWGGLEHFVFERKEESEHAGHEKLPPTKGATA